MQLHRLRLSQVRRFRETLEWSDLEPGLNILHGANESGKSTLVRALRAAFFERYRSSALSDLQPWGDSGAAPEVTVEFQWQGERWQLHKRFLKRPRCDLQVGAQSYSAEEAEVRLAGLLGYTYAKTGASRPEHWGVPGLLWVEQGATQELRQPALYAGAQLQSALGADLGDLASASGDAVLQQVTTWRGELLTQTGRPRGELADTLERLETLGRQRDELQQRLLRYRNDVDRLALLRREHQKDQAEQPWLTLRRQLAEREQALAQVATWQTQQQQSQQAVNLLEAQLQWVEQQLKDQQYQHEELERRELSLRTAQADVSAHEQSLATAQQDQTRAAAQAAEATRQRALAQAADERARDHREHALCAQHIASIEQRLQQLQTIENTILQEQRRQHQLAIPPETVTALRQLAEERQALALRRRQVATRLHFSLPAGVCLQMNGESLTGEGTREVVTPTGITLPDGGELTIEPGGDDLADLERSRQRNAQAWASLCRQAQVQDLDEAEQRHREAVVLADRIRQQQALRDQIAPEGQAVLIAQRDALRRQIQELQQRLTSQPASAPVLPLAQAEAHEAASLRALQGAENRWREAQNALGVAQSRSQQAEQELQRQRQHLSRSVNGEQAASWQEQRQDLLARLARQQQVSDDLTRQIDGAQPDLLRQDIERLEKSAALRETQYRDRALGLTELETRLQTMGAEGLDESLAELDLEIAQCEQRQTELQRRATALTVLLERLQSHRQAATQRLQAPLMTHLQRYLSLLHGVARLTLDDDLVPSHLERQETERQTAPIDALSFGAREQMGLMTRLAYADLLQAAGHPTLIVLDDALVHTDGTRLEAMKRMLFDAATRHQILLLTCHPEHWQDLGVKPRAIAELLA